MPACRRRPARREERLQLHGHALGYIGLASVVAASALAIGPAVRHADIELAGGDTLIAMGATFMQTLPGNILDNIAGVINHRFGTDFATDAGNIVNLSTPESISSNTYPDGEQILLNALQGYSADAVTVFGVSQSAGIEGMALRTIAADPAGYPAEIHMVALAPPSMPAHGGGAGGFQAPLQQWLMNLLYPSITEPFPADNGHYTVDVYCGLYDPVCDIPTGVNPYTLWYSYPNSGTAGYAVHGGYASLSPAVLEYEMNHAQELGISTDSTHFYLMPNVWNFGTAADPELDTYIPMLALNTVSHTDYDRIAPLYALYINAGYDDANHPFEFLHDGTVYTLPGLTGAVSPADAQQYASAAIELGQHLAQLDTGTDVAVGTGM